jgi:MFS transporter, ACS family, DAL5 transporter family protein
MVGTSLITAHECPDVSITALFYTKHELGLRLAYWFGFAAVAGAFGGLIAFGIQHVHATIENWRLLFIIEVWFLRVAYSRYFQLQHFG